MENTLNELLRISEKIFEQLGSIPEQDKRINFIEEINGQLDKRGETIKLLVEQGFQINPNVELHQKLTELDVAIKNRLDVLMRSIKDDMRDLQNAKKNEQQYMNPYSNVRVMDGMYYDKKK